MAKARIKSNTAKAAKALFRRLGIKESNAGVFCGEWRGGGNLIQSTSPIDGAVLSLVKEAGPADYEAAVRRATAAFEKWRLVPAPKRG